jgi:hypothetical protein
MAFGPVLDAVIDTPDQLHPKSENKKRGGIVDVGTIVAFKKFENN